MWASTKIGMSSFAVLLASTGFGLSSDLQAEAKNKSKPDIFSTPDTKQVSPPGFQNRPALPLSPNALGLDDGEMPNVDILNNLPSLSDDQRKQVRRYCDDSRKQNQLLSEQLNIFGKRLKELNAAKDGKTPPAPVLQGKQVGSETNTGAPHGASVNSTELSMANQSEQNLKIVAVDIAPPNTRAAVPPPAPSRFELLTKRATEEASDMGSPDQVKARITVLKQATKDNANNLTAQVSALLSADQLAQFQAMRRGTLVINGDTTTSAASAHKR
jgi:hypothetical protein